MSEPLNTAQIGLTKREMEVLTLVAQGQLNAYIAEQLCVSKRAVEFHMSNIYQKLNYLIPGIHRGKVMLWAQKHLGGEHGQNVSV